MHITNERIAIGVMAFIIVVLFGAYLNLSNQYDEERLRYSMLITSIGIVNPSTLEQSIAERLAFLLNISNSTSLDVKYVGMLNSMYQYNLSINDSWDYVYTTLDGAYLFLPYMSLEGQLSFNVVPLSESNEQ